jgi:NADPH2:quinone reductase
MRAGWFEKTGPAHDVIVVGEMDRPEPKAGEVLVRLHASGINPSDYKRRANIKMKPEFARVVPHSDGAGVVAAVGAGVTSYTIGERVWVHSAQWGRPMGTAAEYVCLPQAQVRRLPQNTSFEEGACFGIPAMTAYHAVHIAGSLKGKTVYVPGATGRVGAYAVQFAKWRGARVIASTGGGEASAKIIRDLGADLVLDRKSADLAQQILQATDQRGVDHIVEVDLPGSMVFDESILAERGAIVSFGAASAPTVPVSQTGRRARNMSLHFIFVYLLDAETFDATCNGVIAAAEEGALKHRIGGIFPLEKLADAHHHAEATSGTGHIIVTM